MSDEICKFDQKLRDARDEIAAILKKHDIGGIVSLNSMTHGEFFLDLEPSWSMIKFANEGHAIRLQLHMKSNPEKTNATVAMLDLQIRILGKQIFMLNDIVKQIEKNAEILRTPLHIVTDPNFPVRQ